jgi:hypothetical protein
LTQFQARVAPPGLPKPRGCTWACVGRGSGAIRCCSSSCSPPSTAWLARHLFTSDEGGIFNTALSLLSHGSFAVALGENIHPGRDGRFYACRELLPTLLSIPPAFAGVVLQSAVRPPAPPVAALGGRIDVANWPIFLTVTFLGPALVAGVLVVLHRLVRDQGGSRAAALWLTVLAGLSTPLAFYARTLFPQIVEALLLALAFHAALGWRRTAALPWALGLGCFCGLGVMTRAAFALVVLWFFGFLLLTGPAVWRRRFAAAALFAVPVVLGGSATGWYNWSRGLAVRLRLSQRLRGVQHSLTTRVRPAGEPGQGIVVLRSGDADTAAGAARAVAARTG